VAKNHKNISKIQIFLLHIAKINALHIRILLILANNASNLLYRFTSAKNHVFH